MEQEVQRYCDKLRRYYTEGDKLVQYPQKRPMRLLALARIAGRFEEGRQYTEREVNEVIKSAIAFSDIEMVRRELFEYKFLDRCRDGSAYWAGEKWRETYSDYIEVQ